MPLENRLPPFIAVLLVFGSCGLHPLVAQEAMDFSMAPAVMQEKVFQKSKGLPPITLVKTGEFVVQKLRLVSDSRDDTIRRNEIQQTLAALLERAAKGGFAIRFGESDITTENYKDVPLSSSNSKRDVSVISVELRQKIDPDAKVGIVDGINKELAAVRPVGRCELVRGQFGIGVSNPEKYRYELIQAIVADVKKIQAMMGEAYTFNITGLDKRIRWARYNFNSLEIIIDYNFSFAAAVAK